jgi:hypothetical protein
VLIHEKENEELIPRPRLSPSNLLLLLLRILGKLSLQASPASGCATSTVSGLSSQSISIEVIVGGGISGATLGIVSCGGASGFFLGFPADLAIFMASSKDAFKEFVVQRVRRRKE